MANLLKAVAMPVFGNYAPWELRLKAPADDVEGGKMPEQPDQIKIQYLVPVAGSSHKTKDMTAYIVPDQGHHVEYALCYTLVQLETNCLQRLDENQRRNGKMLFHLTPMILQGPALSIWKQVLEDLELPDKEEDYTHDLWVKGITLYLEGVAGIKYLKDVAIRFSLNSKKTAEMPPPQFFRRRSMIQGYINGGFLRGNLAIPTQRQLNEAAFLAMPRPWQEKFAETHDEVPEDQQVLIAAFSSYHAADVRNGVLAKIKEDKKDGGRRQRTSAHLPVARSDNRRAGYRSGRGYHHEDNRRGGDHPGYRPQGGYGRDHGNGRDYRGPKRDHRDYKSGGDGARKHQCTAQEEAHHAEQERRRSRSASRRRSRSRSPSARRSPSHARSEENFHNDGHSRNGEARGNLSYSSDEDDGYARPQDNHKSHRGKGGYHTFNRPGGK